MGSNSNLLIPKPSRSSCKRQGSEATWGVFHQTTRPPTIRFGSAENDMSPIRTCFLHKVPDYFQRREWFWGNFNAYQKPSLDHLGGLAICSDTSSNPPNGNKSIFPSGWTVFHQPEFTAMFDGFPGYYWWLSHPASRGMHHTSNVKNQPLKYLPDLTAINEYELI